jgi:hypothetical protein
MNDDRTGHATAPRRRERRWKVISEPGAAIRVEALEMTDEIERMLKVEGPMYLPPPNLERWRKFWNLPKDAATEA